MGYPICATCGGNLVATGSRDDITGELWVKCDDCGDSGYISEMEAQSEPTGVGFTEPPYPDQDPAIWSYCHSCGLPFSESECNRYPT